MGKQLLITALHHLVISEPLGRGDRIASDIFITNDESVIRGLITRPMCDAFGALEMKTLRGSVVAYRLTNTTEEPSTAAGEAEVLRFLRELKTFQKSLWLSRDNCVYMENAYLQWPHGASGNCVTSMNTWNAECTNAEGKRVPVAFTRGELRRVRQTHERLWATHGGVEFGGSEPTNPDGPRLSRAMYFIQGARQSPALSLKVAMYCTATEALLSTDSAELAHKLAERVAWLVGAAPTDRLEIYRSVKLAYGIRSNAIHGSTLGKTKVEREVVAAAKQCDDLLRALINLLISRPEWSAFFVDEASKAKDLEDALMRLCLGLEPEPAN